MKSAVIAVLVLLATGRVQAQQSTEPEPPSIADVARNARERESTLLARKQEMQLKSTDSEKIRGLIVGGMAQSDWNLLPDETAHQIGFKKYFSDEILVVRFSLSPASDSETLVRFTFYGERGSHAERMSGRAKIQVLEMLDGIAEKLPARDLVNSHLE
jgi:hypothetical protein